MKFTKYFQYFCLWVILFILTTSHMQTITKSDTVKNLHTTLKPKYLVISQPIKLFQWIQNVYTYGSEDNLAKQLIQELWDKEDEYDDFLTIQKAPISDITIQVLKKLIKLSIEPDKYKKEDKENKIIKPWLQICDQTITEITNQITNAKHINLEIQKLEKKYKKLENAVIKENFEIKELEKDIKILQEQEKNPGLEILKTIIKNKRKNLKKEAARLEKNITQLKEMEELNATEEDIKKIKQAITIRKNKIKPLNQEIKKIELTKKEFDKKIKPFYKRINELKKLEKQEKTAELTNQIETLKQKIDHENEQAKKIAQNILNQTIFKLIKEKNKRSKYIKELEQINEFKKAECKAMLNRFTYEYANMEDKIYTDIHYLFPQKAPHDIVHMQNPVKAIKEKMAQKMMSIMDKINKLNENPEFIPGTTTAILLAFFADKFDTEMDETYLGECLKKVRSMAKKN